MVRLIIVKPNSFYEVLENWQSNIKKKISAGIFIGKLKTQTKYKPLTIEKIATEVFLGNEMISVLVI